jgi:hypothetical protein
MRWLRAGHHRMFAAIVAQPPASLVTLEPDSSTPAAVSHPMTAPKPSADDLFVEAIAAYRDEYKDLYDAWKNIDTKAQGTVAIAGIFLGAVFTLANPSPTWAVKLSAEDRGFLFLSAGALALAVVLAAVALWVVTAPRQVEGAKVRQLVTTAVGGTAPDPTTVAKLRQDLSTLWQATNERFAADVEAKAKWLRMAQVTLVAGVLLFATVTFLRIARAPVGG